MAMKGKGKQIAAGSSSASAAAAGKRKSAASSSAAEGSASRRRKRRPGVLQFFDDDAVVDDDSGEDEDEDDGLSDLEDEHFDLGPDLNDHSQKFKDTKGAGKSNPLPFFLKEEELSGDELEELIKDRYGHGSEYIVYNEDVKDLDDKISDMHYMKEATIWRIKCMVGCERKIAFSLMQKYVHLQEFGTKMQIISVFALDHVQGFIYIEAEKACDVSEACKGFCSLYSSKLGLVPRNEVPHLLSTRNKLSEVSKGAWVRLKNGSYKGDLAQVVAVDNKRKRAMVKLVPRIDLEALAKKFGGGVSLKRVAVPTPRLINSHELEDFRPHIQRRRDHETGEVFDVLDGLMLKDGYVYKKVSFGTLVLWGVQPSDAERQKFKDSDKDEAEDQSWISSIYDSRKKMRLGEESDQKMGAEKRNGFDLHDLVLFGRKAFGVIVSMDSDSFQVLKGDSDGSEVITVKMQEIKNVCIDKMFKAPDHHMKTISIDDVVKVLDGPLQGRQGIVRHMYRGTLFIYDENQTENSGFFCVKSRLCENITEAKDSFKAKLSNKSKSSFPQSPTRSFQQDDNSRGFNTHRHSDTNAVFSIGQTLRIRKGPLKGYLCRVVAVYRSDITVKLDSLVKVITVKEQFLSVPNFKRDDLAATTSNPLTQEWQSLGGLPGEGTGAPVDGSSWDVELPSACGDSWQGLSTHGLSAGDNDDKTEKGGGDPWGGKVTTASGGSGFQSNQTLDSWDNAVGSNVEKNLAWGKSKVGEKATDDVIGQAGNGKTDADSWNKTSIKGTHTETDGWEKEKLPSNEAGGRWEGDSFKDGKKVNPSNSAMGNWERPSASNQCNSLGTMGIIDGWDKTEKGQDVFFEQGSSWTGPEFIDNDKTNAWDIKGKGKMRDEDYNWGKTVDSVEKANDGKDWGNQASSWDRAKVSSGSHSENWNRPKSTSLNEQGGWNVKVGGSNHGQAEGWHEPRSSGDDQVSCWDKVDAPSGSQFENWKKARDKSETEKGGWGDGGSREDQSDGWNNPKAVRADPESNWDKAKITSTRHSENWNKAKDGHEGKTDGWKKAGFSNEVQADGWGKPKTFTGDQLSRWDEADIPAGGQSDNWSKSKDAGDAEMRGWSKAGFSSEDQTDRWNKTKSFCNDQIHSWNRSDDNEAGRSNQRNNWGGPSNFGRGRGRSDGGRGLGWERERGRRDETGGNVDQESNWNREMDSDGGGRFSSGRGRGRYGTGHGDQNGSWRRPVDADGILGSGRGRGRGRNGFGGRSVNFDDARSFSSGCGYGRNQSLDWKNDQNNIDNGTFSCNPSSCWGVDQSSGWDRPKAFIKDGGSRGDNNQLGGRSRGNSFDGDYASSWRNGPQDHASGWNKGTSAGEGPGEIAEKSSAKQSSNWNNVGDERPSDSSKAEASNPWSSSKAFVGIQSSGGNQGASLKDAGDEGNWNRSNPSSNNPSSCWNDDKRGNWNAVKAFTGSQNSGQDNWLSGKEASVQAVVVGDSWGGSGTKPSAEKQSSGWVDGGSHAADGDVWNRGKPGSGSFTNEASNWNVSKAFDDKKSSNWNHNSAGEAGNEPGNNGEGNWSRQKRFSGGKQTSGWNNDEGGWNKLKSFGGDRSTTWNNTSSGYKEEIGHGDQSEGWNSRRTFSGDQSYGWRGNTFSNRGRGRGRSFGGGRGGRGADREGDRSGEVGGSFNQPRAFGRGQSSGWNKEEFTSGGNGEGCHGSSWGGGRDSHGDQPSAGGRGGDAGGWGARATADKDSWGDWAKRDATKHRSSGDVECGNWNQAKSLDRSGSDWNARSTSAANESSAGQVDGWNQKTISGGTSNSGCPMGGGGSGRPEDAWNRGSSGCGKQMSGGNQGILSKEGDAGGELENTSWDKEAGGWGKAQDRCGDKGGW